MNGAVNQISFLKTGSIAVFAYTILNLFTSSAFAGSFKYTAQWNGKEDVAELPNDLHINAWAVKEEDGHQDEFFSIDYDFPPLGLGESLMFESRFSDSFLKRGGYSEVVFDINWSFTYDRDGDGEPETKYLELLTEQIKLSQILLNPENYETIPRFFIEDKEISITPVPEPLTILGAGTALGFGTLFKRKLNTSKKGKEKIS